MSIYDDPAAVASILQGAINAAEEHGQDGERIGLDVLRAAVYHLRLIDGGDLCSGCRHQRRSHWPDGCNYAECDCTQFDGDDVCGE